MLLNRIYKTIYALGVIGFVVVWAIITGAVLASPLIYAIMRKYG